MVGGEGGFSKIQRIAITLNQIFKYCLIVCFFQDLKISIFLHFMQNIDICFFTFSSFVTIICADKMQLFRTKSIQAVFKLKVTQIHSKVTQIRV